MGLLSDTKKKEKLANLVIVHHRKFLFLSFSIGILWFLLLASDSLSHKTYFSENALLPGLVVREFKPGSTLSRSLQGLKIEAQTHSSTRTWIQAQFRQLGLDVYQQNFSLLYPFGPKTIYHGMNIYAVMRAPRSCSTEALVLSTPYRDYDSIHEVALPSIALMIELARTFRKNTYWSKDIIFLIVEHEMIGFQAWLDAYHQVVTSDYIKSEKLSGTSGSIQSVINLEISDEKISHIDLKIEGLNGQLPNLDLFNLAVELCAREGIATTFHSQHNYFSASPMESWKHNFYTMLSMMCIQATGLPTGGHGLFHRYGIQAITMSSKSQFLNGESKISLSHVGRMLEGVFRSLNNLLEKFHQSFFFYLLPSTRRYISIGLYMTPFALIAAPSLIKAVYLYLHIKCSENPENSTPNIQEESSLWSALDILIISHCFGLLLNSLPSFLAYTENFLSLSLKDSVYFTCVTLLLVIFFFIFLFNRTVSLTSQQFNIKMCIVLLELGSMLYILSLVNISLATVLAVSYVPVAVTLGYKMKLRCVHHLFLLFINPFVFTFILIIIQSYIVDSNASWAEHLVRGFRGHQRVILYSMEDLLFFSNWNYRIWSLTLFPLWFELWILATAHVS